LELKEMMNKVYGQLELVRHKVLSLEETGARKPWPKKIVKAGVDIEEMVLTMRREGQPLRAITKKLRDSGIMVSLATVGRYCQKTCKPVVLKLPERG
jgi:hypothetical protein